MFFSYVGNLPVHSIAPIMAVASAHEQPRPLYEGVYMVGGYKFFYYRPLLHLPLSSCFLRIFSARFVQTFVLCYLGWLCAS
jgi:hypothetical protein